MLRKLSSAALLVSALAPSAPALAADGAVTTDRVTYTSNDYVGFLGGVALPDTSRGVDNVGSQFRFIYGNQISPHFAIEGNIGAAILETGRGRGSDFYQFGGGIDVVASLYDRREAVFTPYALIGITTIRDDAVPDSRDDASIGGNAGIGFVTKPLLGNLRLRGEGRYVYSTYERDYHDFSVGLGFEIALGRVRQKLTVVPAAAVTKVVEVVKEVPRPFVDTDHDTVSDDLDACPDTPRGLKVDSTGCIIAGQQLELRGVTFEFNEARLRPNAQSVLDVVARGMVGQRSLSVEIAGHTDSKGSDKYNKDLSQRRAEAVREYLIDKGVKGESLKAVGYGESEPKIKPEKTDDDRAINRRVEFRVLGQ